MYFNAAHSDRTGERFWHVAVPALVAAAALLLAWSAGPGALAMVALFVAGLGLGSAQGAFWAVPTQFLSPTALGVAVVAINIAGSAGGLVMPHLMGIVRERSGGFAAPTLLVVCVLHDRSSAGRGDTLPVSPRTGRTAERVALEVRLQPQPEMPAAVVVHAGQRVVAVRHIGR